MWVIALVVLVGIVAVVIAMDLRKEREKREKLAELQVQLEEAQKKIAAREVGQKDIVQKLTHGG